MDSNEVIEGHGNLKSYDYIVTSYPERISNFLHMPYSITWILFSFFLFLIHDFGCRISNCTMESIPLIIIITLLPACIVICTIWFSKSLENFTPIIFLIIDWPKDRVLQWYEGEIKAIFSNVKMVFLGLVLSAICLGSLPFNSYWMALSLIPKLTYAHIIFWVGFLGGGMLYSMIRIAVMIFKIGNIQEIKVSIYQHPLTSVRSIGNLLTKIAVLIILVYLLGIASVFVESKLSSPLMLGMVFFFGVIVIFFFIFPQIKIHQIMSKVKHIKLRVFSEYLENALDKVTKDPSSENIQRVRELFEIQNSLNGMGEWPFDTKLLLTIIIGIAIPVVLVILQIVCSRH